MRLHPSSSCLLISLLSGVAHGWLPSLGQFDSAKQRTAAVRLRFASTDEQSTPDLAGKTIYQRVFYRFTPASDVEIHDAVVVEERVRFEADPSKGEGYVRPMGHRTILLRDGQVEEGEIGNDFFTMNVRETSPVHNGAGLDLTMEATLVTAMYLASNPSLLKGRVLEVASDLGLASLLGCIGAGFVTRVRQGDTEKTVVDIADVILSIPKDDTGAFPPDLERLTLTESDEKQLELIFENVRNSRVPASKILIEPLDWKLRWTPSRRTPPEYRTIVASDVAFTYPEAKELARVVAHRLEPSFPYIRKGEATPRFVHVCPDNREDLPYLHRLLEKGYNMDARSGYLNLEKLTFVFQTLPKEAPESALDDLELEVQQFKEKSYASLVAEHSPDYAGGGTGEMFFPMETGAYDASSGGTFMEPDRGRW